MYEIHYYKVHSEVIHPVQSFQLKSLQKSYQATLSDGKDLVVRKDIYCCVLSNHILLKVMSSLQTITNCFPITYGLYISKISNFSSRKSIVAKHPVLQSKKYQAELPDLSVNKRAVEKALLGSSD